jgi:hypothetical protein
MPIIKLGGPQKFPQLKEWATELPTLRTTSLKQCSTAGSRALTFGSPKPAF